MLVKRGFTLLEMMLVLVISAIVIMLGSLYMRGIYRGHLVNEGEQLIMQTISVARNYNANVTDNNTKIGSVKKTYHLPKKYAGINTTWVADTGNIPAQYVTLNSDNTTMDIVTPWGKDTTLDVAGGARQSLFTNAKSNVFLYITLTNIPNYACESLALRLQQTLGRPGMTFQGVPATQTQCVLADGATNNTNILHIVTNPLLY